MKVFAGQIPFCHSANSQSISYMIFQLCFITKVTMIWAPQSGTSASHRVRAPHSQAVGVQLSLGEHHQLSQWGCPQSPAIFSYIHYTGKYWYSYTEMHSLSISGQIRDTKPKTEQMHVLGELIFFREMPLKIGTVLENPGWMVTLFITSVVFTWT